MEQDEIRCKVCELSDIEEANFSNQSKLNENHTDGRVVRNLEIQSSDDKVFGYLGIFIFVGIAFAMLIGFLRTLFTDGLASAIEKKPAILFVFAGFFVIFLLGSREKLEKNGFGLLHKILRIGIFIVVAGVLFVLAIAIFSSLISTSRPGLPDNIRF